MDPKPLSVRLSPDLQARVDEYCKAHEVARSSLVRRAVVQFLDGLNQPTRVATIDSEARAALEAVLERVQSLEATVEELTKQNEAAEAQAEIRRIKNQDFAAKFNRMNSNRQL